MPVRLNTLRPVSETMEPRILHSADLAPLVVTDAAGGIALQQAVQQPANDAVSRSSELVFVDLSVPDAQTLQNDLQAQRANGRVIEIITIAADQDGLAVITETLANRKDISAVHVLAHGSDGQIQLGTTRFDGQTLLQRAGEVAAWSSALTDDADLLLYGCDVAQSALGEAFVRDLAMLTGADVAASTDLTGAAAARGNWVLEFGTGQIESLAVIGTATQQNWAYTLAVNFEGQSSAEASGAVGSFNFLHSVSGSADRLLLVQIVSGNGIGASAVSYAGNALTLLGAQNSATIHVRVEIWTLLAPALGSGSVDITLASPTTIVAGATTYSGVNQASPFGAPVTATGNNALPSVSIAGGTGNMVIDTVGAMRASGNTVGPGQTENFKQNQGTGLIDLFGLSSREVGTGTVVMSHSFTSVNNNWASIAVTINQAVANVPPVLTASVSTLAYAENQIATAIDPALTVTDSDSANLASATVSISGNFAGVQDVLAFVDQNGITGSWNVGTGVLTLSGSASVANYQTALRSITYVNTSEIPSTLARTINLVVNDGAANSNTATRSISVAAVNDAPVNTVPGSQFTAKNTTLGFSVANGNAFSISDVDADSAIVQTTLTVSSGLLNAGAGTTGVVVAGSGTGTVTLTGTLAQINNLLSGNLGGTLSFAPATNFTGGVTLTFATNDQNAGASGSGGAKSDTDVVAISVTDASLWISTEGNATSSAGSGNLSWQDSRVVNFGNPNLSLGSGTTSGTFSIAFNMSALSGDGNVDVIGLHFVSHAVTVGTSVPVNLLAGDVLFSVDDNETFGGVTVTKRDVVLFRPTTYGDYSSGTFSVLLRNPGGTGDDVRDFALVESAVTVGGTSLQAGDFLLLLSGGSRDKDVWHFRANATGVATTGAAPTELVNGDSAGLNISKKIRGIELITQPVTIGGQSLSAGRLLLSLDNEATIGGLLVQAGDVLVLNLLTSGNLSIGTASMLMRASNVGLNGGGETLDALALVQRASSPPVVSVDAAALAYTENDLATVIAPSATVSDADSANFASGSLSVYLSSNGTVNDRLAISHQGSAAGQIGVSGSDVSYGGILIGSFSGGEDGTTPLVVSLNANATLIATQALLRNITFANVSDDPSTLPRTVSVILTDGNGGVSNTATRSISVAAVNDAPLATNLSAAESYTEDTALNLTDIVISDLDSATVTATLTLSLPGAGSLNTATSGIVTSTYNAGTGLWSADGAIADVNVLLAALTFTPTADFNAGFTIATSVSDGVAAPITGSKVFTGTPVNDAPLATNLSAAESYTEDTALNLTDIVISDLDSATVTATLTLSLPGAGSLNTATSGIVTSTYNAGTGLWSADGAIADVNVLLAALTFTPTADFNAGFTIATSVSDGVAAPITGSKVFTGTPVNDAPLATNLSAAESYTEDTALNLTDIVISDLDSATVTATLTLSLPGAGSLNTATSGIVTSTYNAGTGLWSADGAIADVNVLLAALTFTPTADFNAGFTIATSVSDGVAAPITGSKVFTGTPVNDAPLATNLSAAESYTEDTALNLTDIVISDLDSATVTATLTLSLPGAGSLNTATSGIVTSTYNAGTGLWSADGAIADVNVLLAALTFTPTADFNAGFTIATSVSDGVAAPITGSKVFTGTPVNDAPLATNLSAAESYTEDTALNLTDIVISDLDSATVTATLTLSLPGAGSLNTATSGIVTSTYNAGTGLWSADGAIADVNVLLAALTFTPTADFNAGFTIATSVSDGVAAPITGSKVFTGTPVNDAPLATNLSAAESYTEDTALNLTDIVISDLDSATVTATLTLSLPGAGSLNTATSGIVTSTYNAGTGLWSADGAIADVNVLLAALTFTPTADFNAGFTIATSVSDGVAAPITGSKVFTGTPVNDAPLATNLSAAESYTEDTALNLTDIVISDLDSATVTATLTLSLPGAGSLNTATSGIVTSTYNAGTGLWSADGAIADVNVLLAALTFTPTADFNAGFTIATSVSDGVAAPITGSKVFTGTPVNDAPLATNLSAAESYTEDTALNLTDIVISDLDSATVTATLTLSLPGAGSLNTATSGIVTSTYNAGTGLWSADGAIADVNVLLAALTFTPTADFNAGFTIATSVSDGVAAPITGSKVFTGTPVNDAPLATNLSAAESYTEDTALNLTDIVISDLDSATVTATLTLSLPGAGSLNTATSGIVTSTYNAGTGLWSADGAIADVNVLLAALTFTPTADFNAGFTIATSVSDGVAAPITGSKVFTGTPVNDAPLATNLSAAEDSNTPQTVPEANDDDSSKSAGKPKNTSADEAIEIIEEPITALIKLDIASGGASAAAAIANARDNVVVQVDVARPIAQRSLFQFADVLTTPVTNTQPVLAAALLTQLSDITLSGARQTFLQNTDVLRTLEELRRQMAQQGDAQQFQTLSAIALSSGLSIGYIVWLIRGGILLSSMLSALPAWQMIDPLPVVTSAGRAKGKGPDTDTDDPQVERLFDKRSRTAATRPGQQPTQNDNAPMQKEKST